MKIAELIGEFVESIKSDPGAHIYNEISLQHELGFFLRGKLPNYLVQFERNVSFFFASKMAFTKREIDLSVFSQDKKNLLYAIELKYPRNGQHPEQMFSFCKDIAFAEQLQAQGFRQTALVIFADDPLFYKGSSVGIYGFFRGGQAPAVGQPQPWSVDGLVGCPGGGQFEQLESSPARVSE